MFLIAGMIIAITKEIPVWGLFYSMLAGAIIVIFYSSWKSRKEQKELRKKRLTLMCLQYFCENDRTQKYVIRL